MAASSDGFRARDTVWDRVSTPPRRSDRECSIENVALDVVGERGRANVEDVCFVDEHIGCGTVVFGRILFVVGGG